MSKPTKFWLTPSGSAIRIELPDGSATTGKLNRFEDGVSWAYGTPDSERLCDSALEILLYGYEFDIAGLEYVGNETEDEMDRQVSARCLECCVVQASHNDLSLHGLCTRCFVESMSHSGPARGSLADDIFSTVRGEVGK